MSISSFVLQELNQVPATFWGVVAGSFFSLGGVVLSNRNSARNLETQLTNDRLVKKIEREMSLRKDVYLDASEAISAGMIAIARFGNLAVSGDELSADFVKRSPSLAKLNVVADVETMRRVSAVMGVLNSTCPVAR